MEKIGPPSQKSQKRPPLTNQPPKPALTTEPTMKGCQENRLPDKQVLSRELYTYHTRHTSSPFPPPPTLMRDGGAGITPVYRLSRYVLLDVTVRRPWLSHIVGRPWVVLHLLTSALLAAPTVPPSSLFYYARRYRLHTRPVNPSPAAQRTSHLLRQDSTTYPSLVLIMKTLGRDSKVTPRGCDSRCLAPRCAC